MMSESEGLESLSSDHLVGDGDHPVRFGEAVTQPLRVVHADVLD